MDEVQSWWEVPAVAHFCYIFRSAFDLFFFEIAELESALLNIQDPDMGISLDQLITRLLEGVYDKESVNEDNWEEKLHELFDDKLEDEENPLGESYFHLLSPRSKIEVLLKLCELRLDVEGALDDIKNIPSEDMQAKCIGKDSQKFTYWYFCNERLYKETSSKKKVTLPVKSKTLKNEPNNISKQSVRERKNKIDKPWSIACFTIADWEQLSNSFSKSKQSQDKELSAEMKKHLPLLQERLAEKDRFLRKRFLELAPKRSSSRISKVQETKRLEDLNAAKRERLAELKAQKEHAKKEALLLKQMKESRQKRAEERSKAVEERAERAKLRELVRDDDTDSSEEDSKNVVNKVPFVKSQNRKSSTKSQFSKGKVKERSDAVNKHIKESNKNSYIRTVKKTVTLRSTSSTTKPISKHINTYSKVDKQAESGTRRGSKTVKDLLISCNSSANTSVNNKQNTKFHHASQNTKEVCYNSKISYNNNSSSSSAIASVNNKQNTREVCYKSSYNSNSSCSTVQADTKNSNSTKSEDLFLKQNPVNLPNSFRYSQAINTNVPPKIAIYKPSVLSNTSDASKWNSAFNSEGQKMHILYKSTDNLAPKRIKFEQVNFRTVSANLKSSLIKEKHLYKPVQFITYGKIIPPSALVKFGYKKTPNQQVSS